MLEELLTAHPEVDFIQLQINYADWDNPGVVSRECYEIARKHNKSITVMEPVKDDMVTDTDRLYRSYSAGSYRSDNHYRSEKAARQGEGK